MVILKPIYFDQQGILCSPRRDLVPMAKSSFIEYRLIPWTSYQIRKIAGCGWAENAGNFFPATDIKRKWPARNPDMRHSTCVTHVSWCMPGSLTRAGGENVPGIPGAIATHNFTYLARGPWLLMLFMTQFLSTAMLVIVWMHCFLPAIKLQLTHCTTLVSTNGIGSNKLRKLKQSNRDIYVWERSCRENNMCVS